jgi:hypothetical protein
VSSVLEAWSCDIHGVAGSKYSRGGFSWSLRVLSFRGFDILLDALILWASYSRLAYHNVLQTVANIPQDIPKTWESKLNIWEPIKGISSRAAVVRSINHHKIIKHSRKYTA